MRIPRSFLLACAPLLAAVLIRPVGGPIPAGDPAVAQGLVAHWKFDEPGGALAKDETGRHHGQVTPTGAAFVTGGISGGALQLDRAANGMVSVSHVAALATNDVTIVVWTKLPVGETPLSTFLITQHEAWYPNGWLVMLHNAWGPGLEGTASFGVNDGTHFASSTTTVHDGNWHQIVGVYRQGGKTAVYVDGAPAEGSIDSGPMAQRNAPLLIGGLYGNEITGVAQGSFTGWVDDVQAYSRVLSDAEIDLLFRNPGKNLVDLAQPIVISPNGGEFLGSVDVTLFAGIAAATIRYTVDGTEPGATSAAYSGPITLRQTTTMRARLFVNEFPASEIFSATFTELPAIGFEPRGGWFTNSVQVALVNRLGLGTILITTDGTDPVATSPSYTGPMTLAAATTIRARLFLSGFPISDIASATFARVYALDDGIPSAWRERYFGPGYLTDPRVAYDADPDGDGRDNLREYLGGSDPLDATSIPIEAAIRAIPLVSWSSVPGQTYQVLRKASLDDPDWVVVLAAFKATEATSQFIDVGAPPTAIYRIERLP